MSVRVAANALIIPPFECAWLSLHDHNLDGSCCLVFDCKGENDVTIILKPFPGAKRWQHLQRQQGPAGGEQLTVEANYTVILGSHRNRKLKIEKNGEEKAVAAGIPGCTVDPASFTACWISYHDGGIAVGTGPVGSSLSYFWQDPEPAIANIQHVGLSCWDKHVSYRNVQLLPALEAHKLRQLQVEMQQRLVLQSHNCVQQQLEPQLNQQPLQQRQQQQHQACTESPRHNTAVGGVSSADLPQSGSVPPDKQQAQAVCSVPMLLQLVQHAIAQQLQPPAVCHVLQLSEALLPRTQGLYEAAVQLAGEWFSLLVQSHLQELAMLPVDVLMDVLHEPLLDVPELHVFEAVAAWCQARVLMHAGCQAAADLQVQEPQEHQQQMQETHATSQQWVTPPQGPAHQDSLQRADPASSVNGPQAIAADADPLAVEGCSPGARPAGQQSAGGQQQQQQLCHWGSLDEMVEVLHQVRFALMSEPERQAVLAHAFTQACPLVQQCLQQDLQQLQEYHTRRPSPTSDGGFRCQQRRLVLPAYAAADGTMHGNQQQTAAPSLHQPGILVAGSTSTATATGQATTMQPQQAATDPLIASSNSGEGSSRSLASRVPSGWLAADSLAGNKAGSSWRSYRRRIAPSCKELMYVCDGDRNGVIHYIATEYGTKPWVNPVLSAAVDIKASSPASRYTDPKAIVSGQFLNTSFAGPRYMRVPHTHTCTESLPQPFASGDGAAGSSSSSSSSSSMPSTWWQLDLGPQHRLLCNYYVIRHDGSQEGFVRSWALQGSNDLQHWLDLRRHTDDHTIRLPGQYGSWPVNGPAACMPFRAFRLVLLGPTQSQTNPWTFCLSYWELYGYLNRLSTTAGNRLVSTAGSGSSGTADTSSLGAPH